MDGFKVPVAHEQIVDENNDNVIDQEDKNSNENMMQINGIKDEGNDNNEEHQPEHGHGAYISEDESDQDINENDIHEDSDGNLEVIFDEDETHEEFSGNDENDNDIEVGEFMIEDTDESIQNSVINNDNGRPRRSNAGTGVQQLKMYFGGK